MALNKRIDQLPTTSPANNDEFAVWDNSLSSTRKLTLAQIAAFIGSSATGTPVTIYQENVSGTSINIPALVGKTVLILLRGGIGEKIVTTGSPAFDETLFNTSTGDLTPGNPFVGERLTIQYV